MELIELFNYTNNLPNSLAMNPFYLSAGEKVTITAKFQCLDSVPELYYREPQNNIDIESLEAFYIDYYMIYSPPTTYESPVNQPSLDGVIQGYRLLTEDGMYMYYPLKFAYHVLYHYFS